MSESEEKLDLRFEPRASNEGFMSGKMSDYSEIKPTRVVRELIQNSLDAVRKTGRNDTIVRFELGRVNNSEIPAIETYKKVYESALKVQGRQSGGELSGVAKKVADDIGRSLKKEQLDVLCVFDNGCGLDNPNMTQLLNDGSSAKQGNESGSFGVGHFTVLPTSNLRYVLYGGVSEQEPAIAAGCCSIASFMDEEGRKGAAGYLIRGLDLQSIEPYKFAQGDDIPTFLKEKIDGIKNKLGSNTGSVVIIPAFNFFHDDWKRQETKETKLWEAIKQAAAKNFFAAILHGELSVQFHAEHCEGFLDRSNLEKVLEKAKETPKEGFLRGDLAYEAYKTVSSGDNLKIKVGNDDVNVCFRKISREEGSTEIHLCRNGMWITKKVPECGPPAFEEHENFNAVILLDKSVETFHNLVRATEPPAHHKIRLQQLDKDDKKKLREFLTRIQETLKKKLNLLGRESFISDFWRLSGDGGVGDQISLCGDWESAPPYRQSYIERQSSKQHKRQNGHDEESKKQHGPDSTDKSAPSGPSLHLGTVFVMKSPRHYIGEITSSSNVARGEIRFALDEAIDQAYTSQGEEPLVYLRDIFLDGEPVNEEDCVMHEDNVIRHSSEEFKKIQAAKA